MNIELGWLSLLPSLLAIIVAIATRRVIWALLGGVIFAYGLLHGTDWPAGGLSAFNGLWGALVGEGNRLIWGFTLAIGALFGVLEQGGTFQHFVRALEQKQWVDSKRRARVFTWLLGVAVFIESNVSIMTAGATSRPVYDKLGISRQKLAYLIDSTCAPVCILIPLNAWGAFNLGLISQQGVEQPLVVLGSAVLLNAYAIFALFLALGVAWTGWVIGPMRKFEQQAQTAAKHQQTQTSSITSTTTQGYNKRATQAVLASLLSLVGLVPVLLYLTGEGNMIHGDGMLSVFIAIYVALFVAVVGTLWAVPHSGKAVWHGFLRGVRAILPLAVILWLAIALGDVTKALGTGPYLASLLNSTLPHALIPALIFLLASIIAFAIGSSWGTFALMIPIAVPLALGVQMPAPLFIGAALAGGIFGDHASPISDTTIMSSLASGSEHIDHVRSQLPYALVAAGMAFAFYLVAGWFVQTLSIGAF